MADSTVRVETMEITESGGRQIANKTKAAELLSQRRGDIQAAVAEAAEVVQESVDKISTRKGWRVSRVEANFGVKLKADAGVILTRVGAEASFDVRIVVEKA
ncbi:CU044_2847 family protein [Actinophytocola sp.]|uniref:CU044_2847 family protein n=1 Tax=Actinophytocola sp. TaxID=1872138 RepID=UPI002ED05A92